jgi:hypothetical protein
LQERETCKNETIFNFFLLALHVWSLPTTQTLVAWLVQIDSFTRQHTSNVYGILHNVPQEEVDKDYA